MIDCPDRNESTFGALGTSNKKMHTEIVVDFGGFNLMTICQNPFFSCSSAYDWMSRVTSFNQSEFSILL